MLSTYEGELDFFFLLFFILVDPESAVVVESVLMPLDELADGAVELVDGSAGAAIIAEGFDVLEGAVVSVVDGAVDAGAFAVEGAVDAGGCICASAAVPSAIDTAVKRSVFITRSPVKRVVNERVHTPVPPVAPD